MAAETMTAKEIAIACNTDAKRMRRFIRAQAKQDKPLLAACGQGNRYAIPAATAKALIAAFKAAHAPKESPAS